MRSLYVSRDLLNPEPLIAWAKLNGFVTCLQPSEMHVTVCYSKEAFDESKVKPDENAINCRGGLRSLDVFGKTQDTAVLCFECEALQVDHAMYRAAGASSDFPDYRPHVTITLQIPPRLDVHQIRPYAGDLRFGPEVWSDVGSGSNTDLVEKQELTHSALVTNGGILNAEQAGDGESRKRRKRRGLIEWVQKVFNPDQERDDHGRWAPDAGSYDPKQSGTEEYNAKVLMGERIGHQELGYPSNQIGFSAQDKTFELDGKTLFYAGAADLESGEITIYPNRIADENEMRQVVAHEVGHQHFETVLRKYSSETNEVIHAPKVPVTINTGGDEPREVLRDPIKPDGSLREGLEKHWPTYAKVQPLIEGQSAALAKEDGCTDYSTKWWKAYESGAKWAGRDITSRMAMHETFAEINMLAATYAHAWDKRTGGAVANPMDIDRHLKAAGVKPKWRKLYKTFNAVYAGMKKNGEIA